MTNRIGRYRDRGEKKASKAGENHHYISPLGYRVLVGRRQWILERTA